MAGDDDEFGLLGKSNPIIPIMAGGLGVIMIGLLMCIKVNLDGREPQVRESSVRWSDVADVHEDVLYIKHEIKELRKMLESQRGTNDGQR